MTEQDLPSLSTKFYTHDAWNRLTSVKVDEAVLGEYEYNALHWRSVKRSRSLGAGGLDEMRLMYYSANWQLLEQRIDRQWPGSGFTEDERAQTFWGKRYIDDAVVRRRDRAVSAVYEDNFFYVSDAQFSTVVMVKASNARVVERVTYDSYGKARHHFGGDVTGDGAATTAGDDAALVTTIGMGSNSIGQVNYKAEQDLNRDGQITNADRTTLAALTGGADQAAPASGQVSFTTTGSGGSTIHGPDNPIAWDGYVFNAETSQYLVRVRWYDPVLGRWLERDPAGYSGVMSLYAYVDGRPVTLLDPYGLEPWYDKCLNACASFSAGFADSLSFGLTKAIRRGIYGPDDGVYCPTAYSVGEWTEVAIEVGITLGAGAARCAASRASRSLVYAEAAARKAPLVRSGRFVHHKTPLFGHPGGFSAYLPLGGFPAWCHSGRYNLVSVLAPRHLYLHRRARVVESVFSRYIVNLPLTSVRILVNDARPSLQLPFESCECNDAVELTDVADEATIAAILEAQLQYMLDPSSCDISEVPQLPLGCDP